ncbi:MAG: hypothetical protein HW378_2053, partial [Anaerolineales bacterium]|nr:hypothetical protein [Anaerolineales bacterium]
MTSRRRVRIVSVSRAFMGTSISRNLYFLAYTLAFRPG